MRTCLIDVSATLDGQADKNNIIPLTQQENLSIDRTRLPPLSATDSFRSAANAYIAGKNNMVIFVDTIHAATFRRLVRLKNSGSFGNNRNLIFILTPLNPASFSITARHEVSGQKIKNVVGILPGKSKKEEYVIFSAHYDHHRPAQCQLRFHIQWRQRRCFWNYGGDFTGQVFCKKANNQEPLYSPWRLRIGRALIAILSKQFDPAKVMAFNIEMIGTDSKWGLNSAYITGYEKTDMGKILENNLAGSPFKFYPDPYPQQQLFYRSDNATLARQGVPAHTISTSKMDAEKYYHTQEDEIETLDLKNMAEIIKAIAISSTSIIAGQDNPTRVDANSGNTTRS